MALVWSGLANGATPEEYLWKGNLGGALEQAGRDVAARPTDVAAQELYLDILLTVGLADRAVGHARQWVASQPQLADAHYLLARALPDAAQSRTEYERALKLDPDHARAQMGIAALHVAAGRDAEAEAAYQRAVERDPSLAEAWLGLARAQLVRGDTAAAVGTAHRALEVVRDEPSLYFLAAALEPTRARAFLTAAVAVKPRDPSAHTGLAEVLLREGDAAGARSAATAALAINPSLVDAQRLLVFASELERGALDVKGYLALAAVHDAEARDPAQALADYGALAAKYPRCGVILLARGQLALARGDREAAGADLERAMALEPELLDIQQAYGMYALGTGRPDVARPWLERAYEARPWDAALALALGQVYRAVQDAPAARRVLTEAWNVHPWDARVAIAYAQALVDAGQAEAGYQVIRQAVQRISDPSLAVALVTSATAAGRYEEAATILEDLGRRTGRTSLLDTAARLRAKAQTP